MLFQESVVSFVAAMTLATIVTAATTPPPTGSGSGSPSEPEGSNQGSSLSQGSSQVPLTAQASTRCAVKPLSRFPIYRIASGLRSQPLT